MRRFRWSLLFLLTLLAIGAGASSVLAGSHATRATYWNNVIEPRAGSAATVGNGQAATWLFSHPELDGALEVDLNFHAQVKSVFADDGGAGYSTTLRVTVTGNGTSSFTVTLANPWRPHVAYSSDSRYGQDAFAALKLPTSLWRNAPLLTVTAKSVSNTVTTFEDNGLVIGYSTVQ